MQFQMPPDPCEVEWNIERTGRAWSGSEARARYDLSTAKLELIAGKIVGPEDARLRLLGLLLENCGAEAAVRMGNPEVWRAAVRLLDNAEATCLYEIETAHRMRETAIESAPYYPELLGRFLERWTTRNYRERGESEWLTRAKVLNLWEAEAERERTARWHHTQLCIRAESIEVTGESAIARVLWTVRRPIQKDTTQSQSIEYKTDISLWREEWNRQPEGWRLIQSERLEEPTLLGTEPGARIDADAS